MAEAAAAVADDDIQARPPATTTTATRPAGRTQPRTATLLMPSEARRWLFLVIGLAAFVATVVGGTCFLAFFDAGWLGAALGLAGTLAFGALPILARERPREGESDVSLLTRADHPRVFELIDSIAKAMGHTSFDSMVAIDDVNAFASHRAGRPVLGLGLPLLATEPVWSLKSTLGHELGHLFAGDVASPERAAFNFLVRVAHSPISHWHPIGALANRLALDSRAGMYRNARHQEHRADQWGAFVAGKGTTYESLKRLHAVDVMWCNVMDDVQKLVAAGKAPRNMFALLRDALAYAESHDELQRVERWMAELEKQEPTTHPHAALRGALADRAVRKLRDEDTRDETPARNLLVDAERVEQRLTRRIVEKLNNGRELPVIDDKDLARTAMALAEKRVREAIAARAGPAADELPFSGLFQLLYDVLSGDVHKVKWFADLKLGSRTITMELKPFTLEPGPLAAEWLEALLDAAVAHGKLDGTVGFGVWRRVKLGDEWWYTPGLAALLARRQGPWDKLVKALRRSSP